MAPGLVRLVFVAAILGATYLGNTYQAINALPNLIYYQLLAGSLFVSLLVPPLVARIQRREHGRESTRSSVDFSARRSRSGWQRR